MDKTVDRAAASVRARRRRRSKQLRLAIVFVGCVLLFDALLGDRGLFEGMKSRRELSEAEHQISALKRQNDALRTEAHLLQEDPATLELVAREQLGLVRRGEILVVLSDVK